MTPHEAGEPVRSERPSRVGAYEVHGELSSTAAGPVVVEGWDPRLRRAVALRFIAASTIRVASSTASDPTADDPARSRGVEQARALAQLGHPNIASIYDVGEHRGRTYVATELVRGRTLAEWITAGPHPVPEITRMFSKIAEALGVLAEAGFVVADLDPSTIRLDVHDEPRLREFEFADTALRQDYESLRRALCIALYGDTDRKPAAPSTLANPPRGRVPSALTKLVRRESPQGQGLTPKTIAAFSLALRESTSQSQVAKRIRRALLLLGIVVAVSVTVSTQVSWHNSRPTVRPSSPPSPLPATVGQQRVTPPPWLRMRIEQLLEPPTRERLDEAFTHRLAGVMPEDEWLWRLRLVPNDNCRNPHWDDVLQEGHTYVVEIDCDSRGLVVRTSIEPEPPHRMANLSHFSRPSPGDLEERRRALELWFNDPGYVVYPTMFGRIPDEWTETRQQRHRTKYSIFERSVADLHERAGNCRVGAITPDQRSPYYTFDVDCENGAWVAYVNFAFTTGSSEPGSPIGDRFELIPN